MSTVNPRVDFAFKKLFGSEENKDMLMSFINSIISQEDQVSSIELKNPYNEKQFYGDKASILDIKAQDHQGRYFNIEVQIRDQVHYDKRALYYWSRLYTSQLLESGKYDTLSKTISIHVLNFNGVDEDSYHNIFRILNAKTHKTYFEDLEIHIIELEKFDKELSHLKTVLDRWITFLKKAGEYVKNDIPKELEEIPEIKKAVEVLDTMYLEKDERDLYEARLKWLMDEDAIIDTVREEGLE